MDRTVVAKQLLVLAKELSGEKTASATPASILRELRSAIDDLQRSLSYFKSDSLITNPDALLALAETSAKIADEADYFAARAEMQAEEEMNARSDFEEENNAEALREMERGGRI